MALSNNEAATVLHCDVEDVEALADDLDVDDHTWEAEDLLAATQLLDDEDDD